MSSPYSSSLIANYYLHKDKAMKNDIMKTLKMVYIAHGFHLALTENPLIKENVMAWQYGPVIPELYFQLKADNLIFTSQQEKEDFDNNAELKKFLDAVYDKYCNKSGAELSNLTHIIGSPWDITVNRFEALIKDDLIRDHYKSLLV